MFSDLLEDNKRNILSIIHWICWMAILVFKHLPPPGLENLKVYDFLNLSIGSWSSDFIHQVFSPRDANAMHILSFPIFLTNDEDKIIWSKSRDGAFSTKSRDGANQGNVMDNSCYAESGDWMALWNLIVNTQ